MCVRIVERYSVCGCVYYTHAIDPCSSYRVLGHEVTERTVHVGYACPQHSDGGSSSTAQIAKISQETPEKSLLVDQSPVEFTDASGRIHMLAYESCRTWNDIHNIIHRLCANDLMLYNLVEKSGTYSLELSTGDTVTNEAWEREVHAGTRVKMYCHNVFDEKDDLAVPEGVDHVAQNNEILDDGSATRDLTEILKANLVQQQRPQYPNLAELQSHEINNLERRLRRLLKQFAANLRSEASDSAEREAAKLVSTHATHIAEQIVICLQTAQERGTTFPEKGAHNLMISRPSDGQTESADPELSIAIGDIFPNLGHVWRTLLSSDAFRHLKSSFELSLRRELGDQDIPTASRLREYARSWLSFLRLVEPRWRCGCGISLYDDYFELRPGGLARLHEKLEGRVHEYMLTATQTTSSRSGILSSISSTVSTFLPRPSRALSTDTSSSATLPTCNSETSSSCGVSSSQAQADSLRNTELVDSKFLLLCMKRSPATAMATSQSKTATATVSIYAPRLLHQDAKLLKNDQDLFTTLKQAYSPCLQLLCWKDRLSRVIPRLRRLTGVHLTKFSLLLSSHVDVRHHTRDCITNPCACLPPRSRIQCGDYACSPVPPDLSPPIGPELLLHLMNSPAEIDCRQTWILEQFPKKLRSELAGEAGKPVVGWGVYFAEGVWWNRLWAIMFVGGVGCSLVFGTCWSVLRDDVQGGLMIAAWITAVCASALGYVATLDGV